MVSERAWKTFKLQFWVILVLSFFLVTEAIFFFFFSLRLVFILGFQARLRLDTGRECCLEQNPSFFMVFGAHLGISKIRACLVLAIMRFFFPLFLCILGFVLKEI